MPSISLQTVPTAPRPPAPPGHGKGLHIHGPTSVGRAEVERFVRRVYRQHYGADVRRFAPTLVGLHNDAGELVAAAGYRSAAQGPLFLERYLASPVEALLGDAVPSRARIAEVGHLATDRAGEGRRLVMLLGPHLAGEGFDWVVSTITLGLRQLFGRLGLAPLTLGRADPSRLGDEAAAWGSYYDHQPLVLAGRLDAALAQLARRRGVAS